MLPSLLYRQGISAEVQPYADCPSPLPTHPCPRLHLTPPPPQWALLPLPHPSKGAGGWSRSRGRSHMARPGQGWWPTGVHEAPSPQVRVIVGSPFNPPRHSGLRHACWWSSLTPGFRDKGHP